MIGDKTGKSSVQMELLCSAKRIRGRNDVVGSCLFNVSLAKQASSVSSLICDCARLGVKEVSGMWTLRCT